MSHRVADRSGEGRLTGKRLKTKAQSRAEERPLGFVRFLEPFKTETKHSRMVDAIATQRLTEKVRGLHAAMFARVAFV